MSTPLEHKVDQLQSQLTSLLKHLPTAALDEAEPELKKLSVAAAKAKRDVPADAKQVVGKVEQEFSPLEHKVDQMSSQLSALLKHLPNEAPTIDED